MGAITASLPATIRPHFIVREPGVLVGFTDKLQFHQSGAHFLSAGEYVFSYDRVISCHVKHTERDAPLIPGGAGPSLKIMR